jgi:hypothetical protein
MESAQHDMPGGAVSAGARVTSAPGERAQPAHGSDIERIRERAYELYRARGDAPGSETEDWLQAEREQSGGAGSTSDGGPAEQPEASAGTMAEGATSTSEGARP